MLRDILMYVSTLVLWQLITDIMSILTRDINIVMLTSYVYVVLEKHQMLLLDAFLW